MIKNRNSSYRQASCPYKKLVNWHFSYIIKKSGDNLFPASLQSHTSFDDLSQFSGLHRGGEESDRKNGNKYQPFPILSVCGFRNPMVCGCGRAWL